MVDIRMKPKVYLETTIISYLTAWRSPQLVMAAHQESTRSWWDEERHFFDLYTSEAVVQEGFRPESRSPSDSSALMYRLSGLQAQRRRAGWCAGSDPGAGGAAGGPCSPR